MGDQRRRKRKPSFIYIDCVHSTTCLFQLPRDKNRPGKGSYWTIRLDVSDMFEKGNFRRRKRKGKCGGSSKNVISHSISKILGL